MTEEADLITARLRNLAKQAEIREMLERLHASKGLRSIELPQSSCNQVRPELEKLDAVYENLLRREDVLRSIHRAPRS